MCVCPNIRTKQEHLSVSRPRGHAQGKWGPIHNHNSAARGFFWKSGTKSLEEGQPRFCVSSSTLPYEQYLGCLSILGHSEMGFQCEPVSVRKRKDEAWPVKMCQNVLIHKPGVLSRFGQVLNICQFAVFWCKQQAPQTSLNFWKTICSVNARWTRPAREPQSKISLK